jgi:hypothetical protein
MIDTTIYKAGMEIEVLMNNPRNNNQNEWRPARILDIRTIYPNHGERHNPYPMLIVRVTRTYCKAEPNYNWIGNVPIFVDNALEFYDMENDEGFVMEEQIRLKPKPMEVNKDNADELMNVINAAIYKQ